MPTHVAELAPPLRRADVDHVPSPNSTPLVGSRHSHLVVARGRSTPCCCCPRPGTEPTSSTAPALHGASVGYLAVTGLRTTTAPSSTVSRPQPATWRPCSTPAAPPAHRSSPPTPTPTKSSTRGWSPPPTPCSTRSRWPFAALPLFHVNALVVTLLAPLLRGQQAVWAGPLGYRDSPSVRELLEDRAALPNRGDERGPHGLRGAGAVPGRRRHLAACRSPSSGASALPPAVRKDFESAHRHHRWSRDTA